LLATILLTNAVLVRDLHSDDSAMEASEMLDELSATAEEFDEVDAIGETIGIDVAKNDHGHNSSDLSAVKRRNRQNRAKELSSLDFEN
jgi:hypothetical protein